MNSEYFNSKSYELDEKGMIIQQGYTLICDYQPYEIEIKIGNKKKKVIDWAGGAPERLRHFAIMIEEVHNREKWINLKETIHS